jgi:hypothetical protein
MMTRYAIKSDPNRTEFVDVLNETSNGFMVRVTREIDGYAKVLDDFMSKELFETCVNTGFLYEM